jgi:hypothetical protein
MSYNEHLTSGLAAIWDCTTSEAAERIAPKRKRISQDSSREEIPWTAARCNRLLRTITSRVNILRKQSRLCAAGSSVREVQQRRSVGRTSSEETTPPRDSHKISANDPDWIPEPDLRAPSRIYGGRAKSQQKIATSKADSGFSTPFVKRLLNNAPASPAKPWSCNAATDVHPKKRRQLPVQLASSNEEAQRNLMRAFDGLLATTSSASGPERIGARSLMSACLRRVPDYIDLEAEDLSQDHETDESITSSIYSELESLGTNSEGGWSGLREVVRSHGMHYVCAAIDEGLIHDTRISELVGACSKHVALFEADLLLRTWISRDHSAKTKTLEDSHPAITKLTELRSMHDAPELYLRHHTDLIESMHVCPGDVLRPGSTTLKDMIRGLVSGRGQENALAYLEAAVNQSGTSSNATSLPIFSRLASLLASLTLINPTDADTLTLGLDLFAVVNRIANTILQQQGGDAITPECQKQNISSAMKHRTTIHPFIMASTLLRLASPSGRPTMAAKPLDALISTTSAHQSAFVKFTLGVTHHVHRFSDADELESLLLTTSGLISPPSECSNENRSTLNRLAFEIAFAYRDQTDIDIDHHFTAKMATSNKDSAGSISQTPRRRVQVSGYKWEEGLCEWVAATPLPKPLLTNRVLDAQAQSPSRQLLTPKQDNSDRASRNSFLVLPSSPDIIANFQTPAETNDTTPKARQALQERSANQTVLITTSSPLQKKLLGHLNWKHTVPKQVHLKEERAKKAALLAQSAAMAPPPKHVRVKRSHSLAVESSVGDVSKHRRVNADTDELGMLTPARKKSKRVSRLAGVRRVSARVSLPARTRPSDERGDEMSEDELGL